MRVVTFNVAERREISQAPGEVEYTKDFLFLD